MKVLMLSEDPNIAFPDSEVRTRINEYAGLFEELHVVSPTLHKKKDERIDNLFVYYVYSSQKIKFGIFVLW